MAEQAGPLVDVLLRRVRDPGAHVHSRALVRDYLWHAQNLVNLRARAVVATTTLTTQPYRLVYPVTSLLPLALRPTQVRTARGDVPRLMDWRELTTYRRSWFRDVGPAFETWAMLGRDLLLLYPGLEVEGSVDVTYPTVATVLGHDLDAMTLPDELIPLVLDIVEAILLVRSRDLGSLAGIPDRIQTRLRALGLSVTTLSPQGVA